MRINFLPSLSISCLIGVWTLLPMAYAFDDLSHEEEIKQLSITSNKVAAQRNAAQKALSELAEAVANAVQESARRAAREAARQAIIESIEPTIKQAYINALKEAATVERTAIEVAADLALQKQAADLRPLVKSLKKNLLEIFDVEAAAKTRTASEQIPGVKRQITQALSTVSTALEEFSDAIKEAEKAAIEQPLPEEELDLQPAPVPQADTTE